ncbi:MAG TPA: CAP domain-containing protein [Candidatus Cloacimonadota bacterium]|nr:CAP domain-containing protein [Candidatus Cloacimonadota bacterium]
MPRYIISSALLVIACLLSGISTVEFEKKIWELTNRERRANGLSALQYYQPLSELARRQSDNMRRHKFFDHKDQEGLTVGGRQEKYLPRLKINSIGENLAYLSNSEKRFTPQEIVQGWMESPGHRANILSPDFTHLGVGVVTKGDKLWATQNFASPLVMIRHKLPLSSSMKGVKLSFEYLSAKPRKGFAATIFYPDPNFKFYLDKTHYQKGSQPQQLVWQEGTRFTVDVPFVAGKGKYKVFFGWDGSYINDGFEVRSR